MSAVEGIADIGDIAGGCPIAVCSATPLLNLNDKLGQCYSVDVCID
ncbi:MAG: hypothetical protein ACREXO_05830 [Advenella sp.]